MTTTTENIAQTILAQLGGRRFTAMTGAKNLMDLGNGLQFKLPKYPGIKINIVRITINAMGTYDVEFGRLYGMKYTVLSQHEGIYNDMLRGLFQDETGLDTCLYV